MVWTPSRERDHGSPPANRQAVNGLKCFLIDIRRTLVLLSLVWLCYGCADPRPGSLASFDQCTLGAIESVRQGESQVSVECAVQGQLPLVGLPARAVTKQELQAAGLSEDLADILAAQVDSRPRWCTLEVFADKPVAADNRANTPIAESNCSTTDLEIADVVYTRSTRVRLTIARSASGRAVLAKFEPR